MGADPLFIREYKIPPDWLVAYGYAGTLLGELSATEVINKALMNSKKVESHIAFGGGPRMCPGRFLALKELKILLAEMVTSGFRWTVENDQNLEQTYTPGYFPTDGFKISSLG